MLNNLPTLNAARVSLGRIENVLMEMQEVETTGKTTSFEGFKQLTVKDMTHLYYFEKEDGIFQFGSIDLTFKPGELVFLVESLLGISSPTRVDLDVRANTLLTKLHLDHKVQIVNRAFLRVNYRKSGVSDWLWWWHIWKIGRPIYSMNGQRIRTLCLKQCWLSPHDDRYFHLADRFIKLENRLITENKIVQLVPVLVQA